MKIILTAALCVLAAGAWGQNLPIKEVTVFKDGHAFVLAEGSLPVTDGVATLGELPLPVLGTFWPYAAQSGVTLSSVTAGMKTVPGERDAASLKELLGRNLGKSAQVREFDGAPYAASVLSVSDSLILLKTETGVKATDLSRIREATFGSEVVRSVPAPSERPQLSLKLSGASGGSATVGVTYLQKGLRWIPSYKIDLDGKGQARVKLQATLVNELADLDRVTANLVIGVPSFAFKDMLDPIALQQTVANLSPFFASGSRMSNALSGQMAGPVRAYAAETDGSGASSVPEVTGSEQNEDLFVYTVKNVTLKKGERMVLPVAEFTVPYKNVYTLELLPSATRNASGFYDPSSLNAEQARLAAAPKARHQIRLTNTSPFPLTTGPALLLRDGKVLAQGQTFFTAKGATTDVSLTDATDITIKRTDKESERVSHTLKVDGYEYDKVDMAGSVELCNYRADPTEIEVVRYVLGKVTAAGASGVISALDPLADDSLPGWFSQYGNGFERIRFTGLGRVAWKATLPPGGKTCDTLDYAWHYYTR